MTVKLRGDHCQCAACGLYFNSTKAFDKHRTGPYTHDLSTRRCLAVEEMHAKGMVISSTGWWITSARPILSAAVITGAAIGSTPCPDSLSDVSP